MLDFLGPVKEFTKVDPVNIENNVFRLHYKATFIVILTSCLLVVGNTYIGDPIDCIVEEIPSGVMDTYCWIHSTFSVPNRVLGIPGEDHAFPGVAPPIDLDDDDQYDDLRFHSYYQWVGFTLLFQALLFYIPRYIWKTYESGKMELLVQDTTTPIVDDETVKDRISVLVDYFSINSKPSVHKKYAYVFFMCEVLNFINVLGQMFLMDLFLGGEFTTYGMDVVRFMDLEPEQREDPMARVFPKVTKCTMHKFGPSGTIENFDALCVLQLNIINEKIYVFLWFWFVILISITGIKLIYRLLVCILPSFRETILRRRVRHASLSRIRTVSQNLSIGDWFVLNQLGKNMDTLIFKDFIDALYKKIDNQKAEMS